ncbi:MAG: serine/threonine protein kinase [Casimicrobiaceae bacterium]
MAEDTTKVPTERSLERLGERARILDIGAGDPEAPANAIPNIIAHLVETETWRNAATVITGLLLIGLGYWAYHGVQRSIVETRMTSLEALLGTVVKGLDVWVGEHRAEADRLARDPSVIQSATRLAAGARDPGIVSGKCTAEANELSRHLQSLLSTQGVVGFRIVDRSGLVLASRDPQRCGSRLRSGAFRQRLDLAIDGTAQFARPYPDVELSHNAPGEERRPVAWFLAPIRAPGGPVVAALAMGVVTDRELATVFSAARPGTTTEAFAFSDDGLMLTPSRFTEDLIAADVIPQSASNAALVVAVRDPGGDLMHGHVPPLEPAARPLTQAAALAVAARGKPAGSDWKGVIDVPYRSYRGSEVLGTWRWLPEYDMGVIAEISTAEAFAALRYFWISFALIGGFVALSLAAALMSASSLARLQRQFGRLQRVGAYTLEKQISEGGMATIWLARHALLKRPTAIKVLKKHIATDEFIHRFEREVQIASQLLHPNTVRVYDFGRTREGQPYYVMEYLDGVTLAELVTHSGAAPAGRVIHILRQVGAALREAHEHGMIHRDVKPDNVMLCRRGEDDVVKLLDFGLVKNLERAQTRDITKQIRILGTPRYMAPERILNPADVDARSDIYAVGAVAYFLLTGKPIFDGDDNLEIGNQVLHTPAPRASANGAAGIPESLDALIAACLEKDRIKRPQTMDQVINALDRLSSRLAWTQVDAAAWWAAYRAHRKAAGIAAEPAMI